MALKALPPAFISRVCETALRVPFLTPRHLTELSLLDAPKPDDLQEPRLWASARARAVRAALQAPLADGILDTVPVNLGKLFPVDGPFYRSMLSGPEMDLAAIKSRLDERAVDRNLQDQTNIYFSLNRTPAADGSREELREFFYRLSFIENKALAQATSVYLHLLSKEPSQPLRSEPSVAKTYRFHPRPPAPFVRFDDILADYRSLLDRHWIRDGPETGSCIFIERGPVPVRVLFFVRPIPAEAILRIKRRFDEAGQAFELW